MAQRNSGQPQLIQTVSLPGDSQPWGSLNKYDTYSRLTIPDTDFDELINWLPMGNSIRQVPANGATLATLASAAIWMSAQTLNLGQYLYFLCANGHIYQVSLGGTITDVSGATSMAATSDIANWQGTTILFTDPVAQKIYSWNGATFATVFTAQPAEIIAVYSGRLWMAHNNTVTFTNANTFNSLGGDAGSFTITQSDAQPPIIALYPFSGLLYIFGYDWVEVLGNIYDVGSPPVVNFQLNMVENRVGTSSRWSIIGLGSTLYWANKNGIWALQGTFPTKLSMPLDGFFQNLGVNSNFFAAFGYIYKVPCLFWQSNYSTDNTLTVFGIAIDTASQVKGKWFRTVLSNEKFISSDIDQTTGASKVFGCDGTNIFQMYANTANAINSTIGFKYWSFGQSAFFKRMYRFGASMMLTGTATGTLTGYDENGNSLNLTSNTQNYSPTVIFTDSNGNPITWTAGVNITWTVSASQQYEFWEFGIDDIARRFGAQLVLNGAGAMLESVSMEAEITQVKWGT